MTPWNTVLTCEENFQDYYGERSRSAQEEAGESEDDQPEQLELAETYRWLDDPGSAQPPEHYGWVVEVDPFDPDARPRKHTWLGRIRHENAAVRLSESGKVSSTRATTKRTSASTNSSPPAPSTPTTARPTSTS